MNQASLGQKCREEISALILVSVIIAFVALTLFLSPQYTPLFLGIAIVALGFVAVMTLRPNLRRRLIESVSSHQVSNNEQELGLSRYRMMAIFAIAGMIAIFPVALRLFPQYTTYLVVAVIIVNLVAGTVLIAGLASSASKKIALLIVLLFLIGLASSILLRNFNITFLTGLS